MAQARRTIGVLYESGEWSDRYLAAKISESLDERGIDAQVISVNMEDGDAVERALGCDLLVSRVFASAIFRGHQRSHESMGALIKACADDGVTMLNPGRSHLFEIDKHAATTTMAAVGIGVPEIQACACPADIDANLLGYPCVIKPNCGGRTTHTAILRDHDDAELFLGSASAGPIADQAFIVEDYVEPTHGFLTRIEIVDGEVGLVVKRSIAENGLSGYHEGSAYEPYPDPSKELIDDAMLAAKVLGFAFGSFDVIESDGKRCFIDANSVSNVSEDCTELLGCDLMAMHAAGIVRRYEHMLEVSS